MAKQTSWKDVFLGGTTATWVLTNLPFVAFLSFLTMIYIANAHYAEKTVRDIQTVQKDLKELRWHYMSLKSHTMYHSRQSEVGEAMAKQGFKPGAGHPYKLVDKD